MKTVHRLRSFVRRSGRITKAQADARDAVWSQYGLQVENGKLDIEATFGRNAPCYLEIGFGTGQSLLALAKEFPEKDFIAVETHRPGIGALCLGIAQAGLTNIRIYDADVIDVISQCLPGQCLDGVQIFFPDPWPKRRHHARRLIQTDFLKQIIPILKPTGQFYLATDWEDYAKHMMCVMSDMKGLVNEAGTKQFATRSPHRPIVTKFEARALREGRGIWDLCFTLDKTALVT